MNHFWDKKNGGLFFTSDKNEELLTRTKEIYDGAIPSSNSVTFYNLIRLARITGNIDFEIKALELSKSFSDQLNNITSGYTQFMVGKDFAIGPSFEIVVVGEKNSVETKKIIHEINSYYLPNKVIILKENNSKDNLIYKLIPFIKDYTQLNNETTIYICKNQKCEVPTTSIDKMKQLLS